MKAIDWKNLTFSYMETDYMIKAECHNGVWGPLEATTDKMLSLHAAATVLHYGQSTFEGLKAFTGIDGKIRLFRPEDNARRMIDSAKGMYMQAPSVELFVEACKMAVKKNIEYLPPYGTGATLYLRPLLIGTSPRLGVGPSKDYTFIVLASPVGPYFPCGFNTTPYIINRRVDRAARYGTGALKVGGNYASSFRATEPAHDMGYGALFLDSVEHRYIDECGGANFFGVKDGVYVTPLSESILPSITNRSIRTLCADLGIAVEERHVEVTELTEMQEAAACGTAAVISPISRIFDPDCGRTYEFGDAPGPVCCRLYNALQDIQFGRAEDKHGWCVEVK